MLLNEDTLSYISNLSKLKIDDDKKEDMLKSLEKILGHVASLESCDTEDTPITYNVLEMTNTLRQDIVEPSFPRDEILQNAPSKEAGCFIVPKVL